MDIPKKPLAVSRAKKKLPVELDWGPGIPKDRLRYINAREEALIKRFRKSKAARDYAGIPAYPDPGDTAAGEKGKTGTTTGKTTGPGSSSGGTGQGGQNKGPSNASNSASGTSKTASSGSKTASSGSKPSSSSPTSTSSGSKAPNAAAQAASDKLNGKTSGSTPAKTNASAPVSPSKAPNMAASYAAQKLNASQGIQKAASQPKSIQGMINSQVSNPVSFSGSLDGGYYHSFKKDLPGMANPTQFDKTIRPTNMVTAAHVPYDKFVKNYDPNKLTPGAQKIHQAIVDNAFRTNQPVEFFSGARPFNPSRGTKNHPSGQAIDIRMMDPVSGRPVGYGDIGEFAYNPIGSYNPKNGRTTAVAEKVQDALAGPYRDFAKGVLNSFMDNPGVYGDFNNQRWGGSFGVNNWKNDVNALDYMHFDEGKVVSSVNADQAALRKEAANYNPNRGNTQLAGTPFSSATTSLAATVPQSTPNLAKSGLQAALDSWNPPSYSKIPEPDSVGYPGLGNTTVAADPRLSVPQGAYPAAKPPSAVPSDPRLSLPQGAYPARAQTTVAGDPRLSQTPVGAFPAASSPAPMVAGDPRVSMAPGSYPPAQEMGSPPGYFSQFAMTPQDMDKLKQQAMKDFSFGQLMEMRKNMDALPGFMGPITKDQQRVAQAPAAPASPQAPVPNMRPPSQNMQTPPGWGNEKVLSVENYIDTTGIRDPQAATMSAPQSPLPASLPGFSPPGLPGNFRGTAGQAYTYSSPSTFSAENYDPEAAPGDAVPEDDPTYSDSPIQGSENPMQAESPVEEPAVKQQRQNKYASRGATIGSVIAGPLGALIGGTLGWQMGKATPGQKRAIADSPQALNANAQSINRLVEERGGKNEPNMRVRPEALKAVLTNPKMVLDQPEGFTDLEQMLAALAAGLDPETGKQL